MRFTTLAPVIARLLTSSTVPKDRKHQIPRALYVSCFFITMLQYFSTSQCVYPSDFSSTVDDTSGGKAMPHGSCSIDMLRLCVAFRHRRHLGRHFKLPVVRPGYLYLTVLDMAVALCIGMREGEFLESRALGIAWTSWILSRKSEAISRTILTFREI